MSPLRKLAFTTFVLLSASLQPAIAVRNEPRDVEAIREIVEAFRTSIINKDKATFVELFFSDKPEHVTWQMVDDDTRVARFKEFAPEASRVVRWPKSTYLAMIDTTTAADSGSLEEIFRDVTIDTDGLVASVNFDYSILHNGEEAHWGREMWHLVHTEDGWKIISVIWSQRDPVSNE
ncbi:nuclear transport factor 2 family protein [Lysobacter sp. A286]